MEIKFASLESCGAATDTVVAIDVCRAFTTAAYAFAAGAREIILVGRVEEALALRERMPGALVMGEVGGLPVEGFDFGNSPNELLGVDLADRRMIQRTSAGTQGVVRSKRARTLLASSFVCAGATARCIRQLAPENVTFVAGEASLEARAETVDYGTDSLGSVEADWSQPILFYPDGTTSTARLVLKNERDHSIELSLRGLTGAVTVSDSYAAEE